MTVTDDEDFYMKKPDESRPRLGISACLLGQRVRFDGGHKNNRFITGTLAEHLDFETVTF